MSLKDDLQEISGVGEATAEKIISVLADHEVQPSPEGEILSERDASKLRHYLDRGNVAAARSILDDADR